MLLKIDMNAMHIRHVDLNLIAVFDAIMSEGNLSSAGQRLGMSQSAVSHALSRLRSITGDELFVRTGRGMRPTAHALSLAAPLRSAVDLVQQALAKRRKGDPPFGPERIFVVDLPVGFDFVFVPPLLAAATAFSHGVQLRVHSDRAGELTSDLRYGETELALDLEPATAKGLNCEPLYIDEFAVCARKTNLHLSDGLSIDHYLAAHHVTLKWTRSAEGSPVDDRLALLGIDRRTRIAMPTLAGCASVVACSDLLFTIHRKVAMALAVRFDLAVFAMPIPIAPVTLYQIWHQRYDIDPGHNWLRNSVGQIARSL